MTRRCPWYIRPELPGHPGGVRRRLGHGGCARLAEVEEEVVEWWAGHVPQARFAMSTEAVSLLLLLMLPIAAVIALIRYNKNMSEIPCPIPAPKPNAKSAPESQVKGRTVDKSFLPGEHRQEPPAPVQRVEEPVKPTKPPAQRATPPRLPAQAPEAKPKASPTPEPAPTPELASSSGIFISYRRQDEPKSRFRNAKL
jgi:hypothetical protein